MPQKISVEMSAAIIWNNNSKPSGLRAEKNGVNGLGFAILLYTDWSKMPMGRSTEVMLFRAFFFSS